MPSGKANARRSPRTPEKQGAKSGFWGGSYKNPANEPKGVYVVRCEDMKVVESDWEKLRGIAKDYLHELEVPSINELFDRENSEPNKEILVILDAVKNTIQLIDREFVVPANEIKSSEQLQEAVQKLAKKFGETYCDDEEAEESVVGPGYR